MFRTHLSRLRGLRRRRAQAIDQVQQVEGRGIETELLVHPRRSALLGLAHRADHLHPAKAGLNELANLEAHGIAPMARGASIDGARAVRVVLRHVRGDAGPAKGGHAIRRIVALVAAEGLAVLPGQLRGQRHRRRARGVARRGRDRGVHDRRRLHSRLGYLSPEAFEARQAA